MEYTKNPSWSNQGVENYLHYPKNDKGVCVQVHCRIKNCEVAYGEKSVLGSGPDLSISVMLRAQVRAPKEALLKLLTDPKMFGVHFDRRPGDYLRVMTMEHLVFIGTDVDGLKGLQMKVRAILKNRHPWLEEVTDKSYARAVVQDICSTIMTFYHKNKESIDLAYEKKKAKDDAKKPSPFQLLDGGKKDDD